MRKVLVPAVLAALFVHPAMALAQDGAASAPVEATSSNPTPEDVNSDQAILRGIRLEGNLGWDRFQADGRHRSKLGYGGTVGFDGQYKRFVLGAEGSFWRGKDGTGVCDGIAASTVCRGSYNEWGAAVRAGYLVTPQLLVFGKGGYVNNRQRLVVADDDGAVRSARGNTGGYQYGGGVEYSLPVMNMPVYVSAQYVRSEYDNHTSRQRVMGGIGVRFR